MASSALPSRRALVAVALLLGTALGVAVAANAQRPVPAAPEIVVVPAADEGTTSTTAARASATVKRTGSATSAEVVETSSEAVSKDGRAEASNRTRVVTGDGKGVVVEISGTASANTGGNVVTGDGTVTTGDASAVGNDLMVEPTDP